MAAPERFAEKSDLLLQRGHRPYMALNVISPLQISGRYSEHCGHRAALELKGSVETDPQRTNRPFLVGSESLGFNTRSCGDFHVALPSSYERRQISKSRV
jgi:hypothetical protein